MSSERLIDRTKRKRDTTDERLGGGGRESCVRRAPSDGVLDVQ